MKIDGKERGEGRFTLHVGTILFRKIVGKMRKISRGAVHSWSSDGREFEKRSPWRGGAGAGGGWRVDKKPWKLGRWGGGERGSKALATGFTPVESRHLSLRTCFSKNVRFSTERRRA